MVDKTKAEKKPAKAKLVKIVTIYPVSEDTISLWGVPFTAEGEGKERKYFAKVDKETAAEMVEANRVDIV